MMIDFRSIGSCLVGLGLALTLAGCGTTFPMTPDATLPFARGEVDASFVKGGEGKMRVFVEHLGPAAKLDPEATVYVVWIKPKKGDAEAKLENVGTLQLSDNYTGYLDFSTPLDAFDVKISTEHKADAKVPSGREVMNATIAASEIKG